MTFLKKLIYSLYEYYSKGATKAVPYEKSIFVLLGVFLFNLFCIWVLITPYNPNNSFTNDSNKTTRWIGIVVIIIIYYIIMQIWLPEKKLKESNLSADKKYITGFFVYTLFSFLLFVFSVLFKSGKL